MNRLPERGEIRSMLSLAAPISIMQLGMMFYGVVDTLFMGRIGSHALAGVGIAYSSYAALMLFGMGALLGIDTLSSRAYGAGNKAGSAAVWLHALVLGAVVSAPLIALLSLAGAAYRWIGVEASVLGAAVEYLRVLKWMIIPAMLFTACRHYLQSMDITRPLLWAMIAGNVLNIVLDYGLIFGKLGFPEMGIVGCAAASLGTKSMMFLIAGAVATHRAIADGLRFRGWKRSIFKELIILGMPAGLQMLVEVSSFSLVTTLMGRFGAEAAAAHQVTLNLASVTFMIPLGISFAAAVRVGQGIGRDDPAAAARSGNTALFLGTVFMICAAAVFFLVPGFLLRLYTAEPAVIEIGIPLLLIAALFQVFDGVQVVMNGALRGLGETRIPLYANIVGHALIGIPFGYWLAFHQGVGPRGLWIGLLTGLSTTAVLLLVFWRRKAASRVSEFSIRPESAVI